MRLIVIYLVLYIFATKKNVTIACKNGFGLSVVCNLRSIYKYLFDLRSSVLFSGKSDGQREEKNSKRKGRRTAWSQVTMYLFSEKSSSSPETNTSLFPDTKENRSAANFSPTPSSLSSSPSVSSWSPSSSSSSSSSSKRKIVIAVAVPTIAGFFVVVIIWIYRYKRKKRSPGGNEVDVEFRAHDSSANQLMLRRDSLTHVSEFDMQLDRKWEIDRKFISLQEELGKGEFGIVRKGEMLEMPSGLGPGLTTVAVKMLNSKFCILKFH